jgi:serralysin
LTDIPGNSSTTATLTVGGSTTNSLETAGDHDWFRITLTAGQPVVVTVNGQTLVDPYLYIRDSSGTLLYSNDDIIDGVNRNSQVAFSPTYTGTYYIDVGAFNDSYTGTYQVSVQPYTPPPLATNDQIANQLTSGYWGGDTHHFNVTQGGTITVNISTLTAAEQNLARAALQEWSDIIGVHFQEVISGGQIVFDHSEGSDGMIAATDANWSNGIITSAHVQISSSWVNSYGTGLNSYSFQTYIHEIGHALGLGHAGNYNNTASYPYDALFQNDAWSTSIMSYFDQHENTYFAGQGFSRDYAVTPMGADILAMQTLYGLSTTTRVGDTTYGFNSNAGGVYNASLYPNVAYTIFDNGGTDTLDFSGSHYNQIINLNPETFSNVDGNTGNLTIARGVVIENAIGGFVDDTLIGNSANNILDGRGGTNTVSYATATTGVTVNMTIAGAQNTIGAGVDTLLNYSVLVGSSFGDFLTSKSGSDVTVNGGAGNDRIIGAGGGDHLFGDAGDDWFVSMSGNDITGGLGFDTVDYSGMSHGITVKLYAIGQDFGDGTFDQLDQIEQVVGTNFADHLYAYQAGDSLVGGGGDDILEGNAGPTKFTGGAGNDTFSDTASGLNGDTITDLSAGDKIVITDASLASFSYSIVGNTLNYTGGSLTLSSVPSGHLVASAAATGVQLTVVPNAVQDDFNGDGRSDVLWRNDDGTMRDWLAQANGSFVGNFANFNVNPGASWHVVGTGDFNGDGRSDVLWQNDSGQVTDWLGQPNGRFVDNQLTINPGTSWHVVGTGDFNGDGRSDVLWRNDDGTMRDWLAQANGSFVGNFANFNVNPGASWHVVGTGDFNGDGRSDVLWQNDSGQVTDWLGQPNGRFVDNQLTINPGTSWHVVGTGDFNGDGRSDVLWRNDDGTMRDWLAQANGSFVGNFANFNVNPGASWHVVGTGDFNGDGRGDVLWQNDSGQVTDWLGQPNGSFVDNQLTINPGMSWHVQEPFVHDPLLWV